MTKPSLAIYSGAFPDTTFVTLLCYELAKSNEFKVHIYGQKRSNKIEHFKDLEYRFTPDGKIPKLLYTLWYFLKCWFKNAGDTKRLIQLTRARYGGLGEVLLKLSFLFPMLYHRPGIFHVQWLKSYEFLKDLLSIIDSKVIVSVRGHQLSISAFTDEKYNKLAKEIFDESQKIHSISDDMSEQVTMITPANGQKIVKICPAIDVDKFVFRGEKALNPVLKILTVCRLNWKKGLNYALLALKELKDRGVAFEYKIVGNGLQLEEITYLISGLGLQKEVQLMGNVAHQKVKEYLYDADVFLMPSIQEGFSNAVLEAQSTGVPCLVSNAEGLSENVVDRKTGYVFEKGNKEEILAAIDWFLSLDDNERKSIQNNCRNRVVEHFSHHDQIQQFLGLYKSLV